jgi:hypothetical protein
MPRISHEFPSIAAAVVLQSKPGTAEPLLSTCLFGNWLEGAASTDGLNAMI